VRLQDFRAIAASLLTEFLHASAKSLVLNRAAKLKKKAHAGKQLAIYRPLARPDGMFLAGT
jgi:hypothetical protein